ncbi:MAG: hypothetical protein CMJ44_16790 [Pimelobacter sp.]|nr:hypothetical protein [Pimelobacter sp.]
MPDSPELIAYTQRLARLTAHVDPTASSPAADEIRLLADKIDRLPSINVSTMVDFITLYPASVYTLGLAVGLSQEKLKNQLRQALGTSSWVRAANEDPAAVIAWLDSEFDLLRVLDAQRSRAYTFGDVLAARGTSRQTASRAGTTGLLIEDQVEAVVQSLGLPYMMRGRFVGVNGRTAPADIAIPSFDQCMIAVGCKGFDSTGSKLTAAVSEITEMVDVHRPHQYLMAVVDGIGWLSRMGDFRRMFDHYESHRIEGLYTLADLDLFHDDLAAAARRVGLLP